MLTVARMLAVVVALLALIPAAGRAQTFEYYVSIEGTKQGMFANESARNNHTPRVVGVSFDYLVTTPRDPVTGISRGRRLHGPVVLTKEWGPASPQLFQALVSNEVLKSVVFEFYQTNSQGGEELGTRVKLSNAMVTDIHQYSPSSSSGTGSAHLAASRRQLEDVSFTFGSIEIEHLPGKTMATDQMGLR
jgi:type VI secretion system secreted protein Hcp